MNFCHLKIVKTDKYFLNGGDFLKNQLIKHNKNFSHIQYEKNERRQQYIDSKRFVVRFRFYWRPPEGFYFHRRDYIFTGGIIFSPEGFQKNFTQGDLHSTGGIQMSFLGDYNSTGGIQLSFLGGYNSTGGIQLSFLGV